MYVWQLDDFFPFDPLLLKHSAAIIAPLYQVWQVIMHVRMICLVIMHVSPSHALPRVTLLTPFHVSQPHGATRTPRESNLSYGDESESDASFALAHSLQATTTTATTATSATKVTTTTYA